MGEMAFQIISFVIVYSTDYSGADQRKHQSSVSLAFVWGIHRSPVNSPHKWPVTRKMFPFDDVIIETKLSCESSFVIGYSLSSLEVAFSSRQWQKELIVSVQLWSRWMNSKTFLALFRKTPSKVNTEIDDFWKFVLNYMHAYLCLWNVYLTCKPHSMKLKWQ